MPYKFIIPVLLFAIVITIGCGQVAGADSPSPDQVELTVIARVDATQASQKQSSIEATVVARVEATISNKENIPADADFVTEASTVQSAVSLYVAQNGTITAQRVATNNLSTSTPALSPTYMRVSITKCTYSWTNSGIVSQVACP
ncbi:hypothetical protein JYU04_01635 [Dehalococcoides mccartyi]|nr:hypothetical protein [Dehalococcoides mccartyi]